MARRRKARRSAARQIVVAAPSPVVYASQPASRPRRAVRYVASRASRIARTQISSKGIDLWSIGRRAMFAMTGGLASETLDAVTLLTDTKIDDDPWFRAGIKSAAAIGVGLLAGQNGSARDFVAGMIGHTAGTTLDELALKKYKALIPKNP